MTLHFWMLTAGSSSSRNTSAFKQNRDYEDPFPFAINRPGPHQGRRSIAMNMLIEGLLERGHQIKVLAVTPSSTIYISAQFPGNTSRKQGLSSSRWIYRVKLFPAFKKYFHRQILHAERLFQPIFLKDQAGPQEEDYDIVQLETIYMASYIGTIRENSNARIVLRAHNMSIDLERDSPVQRVVRGNLSERWYLNIARSSKDLKQKGCSLNSCSPFSYDRTNVARRKGISGKDADKRRVCDYQNPLFIRHAYADAVCQSQFLLPATLQPMCSES